jgi:hypothetical protein
VKFILPDVDEFAQQFLAIPCNIRDRRLRPDDLSETIDKARKIAVSMKFDPLVSASGVSDGGDICGDAASIAGRSVTATLGQERKQG